MEGLRVWDLMDKKMYYDDFMIGTDGELYQLLSYTNINEDDYVVNMVPAKTSRYIVMRRSKNTDKHDIPIYEHDFMKGQDGTIYKVEYSDEKGFYGLNEKNECLTVDSLTKFESVSYTHLTLPTNSRV